MPAIAAELVLRFEDPSATHCRTVKMEPTSNTAFRTLPHRRSRARAPKPAAFGWICVACCSISATLSKFWPFTFRVFPFRAIFGPTVAWLLESGAGNCH